MRRQRIEQGREHGGIQGCVGQLRAGEGALLPVRDLAAFVERELKQPLTCHAQPRGGGAREAEGGVHEGLKVEQARGAGDAA